MLSRIKVSIKKFFVRVKRNNSFINKPVSSVFGLDRGTPIDRYYIEEFLKANSDKIQGNVMEVGEDTYTRKFGNKNLESYTINSNNPLSKNNFEVDLCSYESYKDIRKFDCIIATQVLNFIYDQKGALNGLRNILSENGTVLATLAGLTPISRHDTNLWGDYWRYTDMSAIKLFKEFFHDVEVSTYGNFIAARSFIDGYAAEEIKDEHLNHNDENFQIVICIKASRPIQNLEV